MPTQVRDLPNLVPTSSGSSFTNGIGWLDDASSLTIYVSSSAGTASTGATALRVQVSQFDPFDSTPTGVTQSTQFFDYMVTATGGFQVLTTGAALTMNNISFRGLRLANLTSAVASEVIARITKQISV